MELDGSGEVEGAGGPGEPQVWPDPVLEPSAEPPITPRGTAPDADDSSTPMRARMRAMHREILRRTFLGANAKDIALALDVSHATVKFITTSPLFRAALAEMQAEADSKVTDTAARLRMERRLEEIAEKGITVAESAMTNPSLNGLARAKIAFGFLDRVGMGPTRKIEHKGDGYREIIERLDELERLEGRPGWEIPAAPVTEASVTFTVRKEAGHVTTVGDAVRQANAAHTHAGDDTNDAHGLVRELRQALGGGA